MSSRPGKTFVVVDCEADGPAPVLYSMVCFAAVVVEPSLSRTFYGETAPISDRFLPDVLAISAMSREQHEAFDDPAVTMQRFVEWLDQLGGDLVFISDNNGFDWQWINYYLHRYVGRNPFGHSSRRIGDLWAGFNGGLKGASGYKAFRTTPHDHNPLNDVLGNAEALLGDVTAGSRRSGGGTLVNVQALPSREDWAQVCADRLTDALASAASKRAVFAGSGGSTPAPIYARMKDANLDWGRVVVTLIDERYVPETSPDSNARLLKQTLLTGPAAKAAFVPLYSPAVTVDRAAAEATLRLRPYGRLDAVLLGMGEDGHICSMFPHSPTLKTLLTPDLPPAVLGVPPGRDGLAPSMERLSINLPYLAQAGRVVLAITGRQKRAVFERDAGGDPTVTPIAALMAAEVPLEVLWTEAA